MNASDERNKLNQAIKSLKAELDAADLNILSDFDTIQKWLDKIDGVYVQIKQFISRFGVNDWNGWGPATWNHIERNEATLKRKLLGHERDEMRNSNRFNKRMAYLSALFAAISTIAAVFSAYSGCTPSAQSKAEQASSAEGPGKTPNPALKSDLGDAARSSAP